MASPSGKGNKMGRGAVKTPARNQSGIHNMKTTVFFAAFALAARAQQSTNDPLGIDGEVKMINAELSELIIAHLQQDGKTYNLTPDDMVKLKAEHVSDNVLRLMLNPHAAVIAPLLYPYITNLPKPTGATPASGASYAANPNDPLSPHDSGSTYTALTAKGSRP
jgi:hypothetical protein